jgi:hypothetical protein
MYGIAQYIGTTLVCLIWHFQTTKTGGIVQKKISPDDLLGMNCMHSIDCISQHIIILSAAVQGSRQTHHFTSSH